jgi:hypothetical protein
MATATRTKYHACAQHQAAASEHEAAAYHHREACHHFEQGQHDDAKVHANSARSCSHEAVKVTKAAHQHSQK